MSQYPVHQTPASMPCFSVPMGELLTMVLIPDELLLQFRCTGSDSSNLQG